MKPDFLSLSSLRILTKRYLKRPSFWLLVVLGIIVEYVLGSVALPSSSNVNIGLVNAGGSYAEAITDELLSQGSVYHYVLCKDKADAENAVAAGTLDTAFVFDERLDAACESGDLTSCVDIISSTSSTKLSSSKEEVFTVFLALYSDRILLRESDKGQIFVENSEEAKQALVDTNESLQGSDALIKVFFEDLSTGEVTDAEKLHEAGSRSAASVDTAAAAADARASSAAAVASILIFAAALFFAANRFSDSSRNLLGSVGKGIRIRFLLADTLVPLFLFSLFISASLCLTGALPTSKLPQILLALLVGVPLTTLWAVLFAGCFRIETIYLFTIVGVLLLNIALLAVSLTSLTFLVRSIAWIRFLMPGTWYALLLGI